MRQRLTVLVAKKRVTPRSFAAEVVSTEVEKDILELGIKVRFAKMRASGRCPVDDHLRQESE